MQIFISCTTDDMGIFRDALCEKPTEWWGSLPGLPQFSSMRDAKAESIPPVDWSIRQASQADIVVLLLGQHHGTLAETPDPTHCGMENSQLKAIAMKIPGWSNLQKPERFSYTQWEVLAAMAAQVPILLFTPDRYSNDNDLQASRQNTETDWLNERQVCFSQWVRKQFTEDHFTNRIDLLNKVRKAILRRQQRRRRVLQRIAVSILALLLAIMGGIAYKWSVSTDRIHLENQKADRLEDETLRRKYAVALGGALAMLGRSSVGVGRPVFEKALVSLGMPQSQVAELSQEYNRLDEAVLNNTITPAIFLASKKRLAEKTIFRLNVVKRAPANFIEFGQSAAELLLLLKLWDVQSGRNSLLLAAQDSLLLFQASCKRVEFPKEILQRVEAVRFSDLDIQARRDAIKSLVQECLYVYEMEPR